MAFSLKFPNSRRQQWEQQHRVSQFGGVLSTPKDGDSSEFNQVYHDRQEDRGDQDQVDAVGSSEVVAAGGTVSRTSRKYDKPDDMCTPKTTVIVAQLPDKIRFSRIDLFFVVLSMILYVADIVLDCSVAYNHYKVVHEHPLFFIFTVVFIILSAVVTSVFSLWWYYFEYRVREKENVENFTRLEISVRVTASIFLLGPVMRYIDTIRYGLKSRRKNIRPEQRRYYFNQMQYERVDGAMLRLFEAFFEAAPQTLLQIYIVLDQGLEGLKEGNTFLSESSE